MKCPFCAEEVQDEAIFCKHCKNNLPKTLPNKVQPSQLSVFLNQHKTGVIIVVFAVLALGLIIAHSSPGSSEPQPSTPAVTQTNSPAQTFKTMPYEVVKNWTFPDDGVGEVIVIPPSDLNDTDMANVGLTLKSVLQNHKNALVFVFTDKQAAALRDKELTDSGTPAENALYDSNFVGTYNKNGNTGYHEFDIMFGGVDGHNDKQIKY